MKIAIFTDIYAPWGSGGIASSIKAQKMELEKLGHEVTVFCPGFDAREKNVVNVPSHRWLRINKSVVSKRPTVVEEFVLQKFPDFADFDVVHVHYEASCSLAGCGWHDGLVCHWYRRCTDARIWRLRLIFHIHGNILQRV